MSASDMISVLGGWMGEVWGSTRRGALQRTYGRLAQVAPGRFGRPGRVLEMVVIHGVALRLQGLFADRLGRIFFLLWRRAKRRWVRRRRRSGPVVLVQCSQQIAGVVRRHGRADLAGHGADGRPPVHLAARSAGPLFDGIGPSDSSRGRPTAGPIEGDPVSMARRVGCRYARDSRAADHHDYLQTGAKGQGRIRIEVGVVAPPPGLNGGKPLWAYPRTVPPPPGPSGPPRRSSSPRASGGQTCAGRC